MTRETAWSMKSARRFAAIEFAAIDFAVIGLPSTRAASAPSLTPS
ncbi:hypothetical protein SAMN05444581_10178 [Methylocapsa palsarum]|uniref:Uncharacterized protein n=1 Tax=Methylocapsa palsarum TaxID=1612308 RepID=A0A1I3VVG6_9HYPH|nr:hypothetical protein SAMN05444581_10178 [Methylocapsa palsarum]